MSGSRTGSITQWDYVLGQGLITEDGDGVYVFSVDSCAESLRAALLGRAIPQNALVSVSFDLDVTNRAINVSGTFVASPPIFIVMVLGVTVFIHGKFQLGNLAHTETGT